MRNDASASWNGFEFQGKITIYQVLLKINALIRESDQIKKFSFRVEGEEDFDILENDQVIELAQIKAKLSKKNISDYFDALIKMTERDSYKNNPTNVRLTFHTAVKIQDWGNFVEKYDKRLEKLAEKIAVETCEIKKAEFLVSSTQIKHVKRIIDDITLVDYPVSGDENNQEGVTDYCSLGIVNSLIVNELKVYFEKTDQQEKMGADSLEKYLYKLLCYLNEHINQRHSHPTTVNERSFLEITTILNSDILIHDDQYMYGKVLDRFMNLEFQKYCEDLCSLKDRCLERENCYLKKIFRKISAYPLEEGYLIIRRCFPHIIIKSLDRDDYQFDPQGIRFLYKLFVTAEPDDNPDRFELIEKAFRFSTNEDREIYFPTGINNVDEDEIASHRLMYQKAFRQNIYNSDIPIEDVYESNGYITGNISYPNILEEYNTDQDSEVIGIKGKRYQTIVSFVKKDDIFKTEV